MADWAPSLRQAREAATAARSAASSGARPSDRPTAKTPTKVSPAPVVSTISTLIAGMERTGRFRSAMIRPRDPRVAMTARSRRSDRVRARSDALPLSTAQIVAAERNSLSLTTSTSASSMSCSMPASSRSGGTGARLTTVRAPASRAALAAATHSASGISICRTRMLCGPSRPGASAPAVTQPLAPLATVMAFSPAASIEMKAQPVRSGAVCSPPTSMPSPRRLSATA